MDPHRATSDLLTVEHEVVMLSPNLSFFSTQVLLRRGMGKFTHSIDVALLEVVQVFIHWRCEGMMTALPTTFGQKRLVLVGLGEQGKLGDP